VLGVIGALVTIAVLGFLTLQAVTGRDADPRFRVEVVAVEDTGHGVVAEVRVHNDGGTTAEAVHVVGTVPTAASAPEATATISYVPPHSSREVALVLPARPGPGGVEVRIAGYTPS
jgi:uncharacterized protein (TIGR02588 family)